MEKYPFKDIIWLITKRGVIVPIIEERKTIKSVLNSFKCNKTKNKVFNYNCIIKDIFSEDELKSCLSCMKVINLALSRTLNILVEKECNDIKEWYDCKDEKLVLRQALNSLELTDKQIRIIKNDLQRHFVKQINVNKNRTK